MKFLIDIFDFQIMFSLLVLLIYMTVLGFIAA
jgi:hypothetical protein